MNVPVDCVKNFNEHRVVILFMVFLHFVCVTGNYGLLLSFIAMFLLYSRLKKFIVDVTMCPPTLKKE